MIDSKPKIKAVVDTENNRLFITMSGNIDDKSMIKLCSEVRLCVTGLKRGFEVINDISQCNLIHITALQKYKKIIDYLILNNSGEMIRIIDNNNISTRQIKKLSENTNCYKPIYAKNNKEAVEKLELLKKRNGIRFNINKLFIELKLDAKLAKGSIIDISTSGCSIASTCGFLTTGSEPIIILTFDKHDNFASIFKIKSTVVRADNNSLAVQFSGLEDERKEYLYKRIAYEVTRSTYSP